MARATQSERLDAIERHLERLTERILGGAAPQHAKPETVILGADGRPVAPQIVVQVPEQPAAQAIAAAPAPPDTTMKEVALALISAFAPLIAKKLMAPPPDPMEQFRQMMELTREMAEDNEPGLSMGDIPQLVEMGRSLMGDKAAPVAPQAAPNGGGISVDQLAHSLGLSPDAVGAFLARQASRNEAGG